MSQVYSTEPQTTGNVIFETNYGPLSINLWCKEAPRATRYFLQLCADGYYNNIIFHRIVPNFLIQTGDAEFRILDQLEHNDDDSNSNSNSNSNNSSNVSWKQPPPPDYQKKNCAQEALDRRRYEVNSRIRFNHRGQVALALGLDDNINDGDDDDHNNSSNSLARLQPQFFITLDDASHLDGNHVVFGCVTGPTIFNALRIGQIDVINDENGNVRNFQPRILSEAPKILNTKIVAANIEPSLPALVPTEVGQLPWKNLDRGGNNNNSKRSTKGKKSKKKARKGIKNLNLLSFGEEFNEDDDNNNVNKIQSSHDLLGSSSSSSRNQDKNENISSSRKKFSEPKSGDNEKLQEQSSLQKVQDEHLAGEKNEVKKVKKKESAGNPENDSNDTSISNSNLPNKSNVITESKPKKISLVEARRAKYSKRNSNKGSKDQREKETMAKFKAFQKKLTMVGITKKLANKSDENEHDVNVEEDNDWMQTKFKCKKHIDQDAKTGSDGRGIHDYEVIEERSSATDRKRGKRRKYK